MDLFVFIHVTDPTKVKIVKRELHAESELEASLDKLFDEGDGTNKGDSAAGGDYKAEIELVTSVQDNATKDIVAKRHKHHRRKRQAVTDASELLASSILNAEVGIQAVETLPLVTSLVSATSKREGGDLADLITRGNIRTVGPTKRSVAPPLVITKAMITCTTIVRPNVAGSSCIPRKELSIGYQEVKSETLHELFVLRWNVSNDTLLDDHDSSWEFINHLSPLMLFSEIRLMDYHHLFMEFNVETAHQSCLNAEVRMHTEYCLNEKRRIELECVNQANLLKARDDEVEKLKAQLLLKETKATEDTHLHAQVFDLKLKDLNVVVSSLKSENDGIVDQVHALETTPFGLCKQKEGRNLADVTAYNPAVEVDFNSPLQNLHGVDFPLLSKLKSHKDTSVEDIMSLLRLEGPLLDAPDMSDLMVSSMGIWTPLSEPLSVQNLTGTADTSDSVPATVGATTTLSTTFASSSSIPLIIIEDYEIVFVDG
uniref:Uncharacterized protein n=1 Tax=Tanacetum cinerariifolium TaxID=118510 RepID=A0A6L2L892_TANCI|nr:hypothetical protein [Tanacetum cinerariifolium]